MINSPEGCMHNTGFQHTEFVGTISIGSDHCPALNNEHQTPTFFLMSILLKPSPGPPFHTAHRFPSPVSTMLEPWQSKETISCERNSSFITHSHPAANGAKQQR